jgi:hypothetical protein
MNTQQNFPDLRVENIQYFPEQCCPLCGASATTDKRGNSYVRYSDYFGSALRNWEAYIGYVYFPCQCEHQPGPGMRVARVGDALIPLHFSDKERAKSIGLDQDVLNAHETAQAVDFLVKNADPMCTAQHDELRCMLFEVASGKVGPDEAHLRIQNWVFDAAFQEQTKNISG